MKKKQKKDEAVHEKRLGELYARLYGPLRRRAEQQLRGDPAARLGPCTLLHEAWMRMARRPEVADTSTDHFIAIVGRQMKLIRIDDARARSAQCRRGRESELREEVLAAPHSSSDSLDLARAFAGLEAIRPRLHEVAVRYMLWGQTVREVALDLGVSESLVDRDLRFARAFMCRRLEC